MRTSPPVPGGRAPAAGRGVDGWRRRLPMVARWLVVAAVLLTGCGAPSPSVEREAPSAGAQAGAPAGATTAAAAAGSSALARGSADAPGASAVRGSPEGRAGFSPTVGFRSPQRLLEHYRKHGDEFSAASADDYLRQAQRLRDAPVGGAIVEMRRGDGSYARFDRSTGAFLAFDADGTIRTYFRPNDGEAYFRRQGRRRAAP